MGNTWPVKDLTKMLNLSVSRRPEGFTFWSRKLGCIIVKSMLVTRDFAHLFWSGPSFASSQLDVKALSGQM
jgi:hypothetical protein